MFAPARLLSRWAHKGLTAPPEGSRHTDGITRRALISMSTATLIAAQAGKVEAAALWLGKPLVPTVLAPTNWAGAATAQNDAEDPTVLGDGSYREQPVVGFDFSDYYPFDPPSYSGNPYSNIGTVLVSHADPSGLQLAYVGVSLNDGLETPLPVGAMKLSPRTKAFGFPFAMASLLPTFGNIKVKVRVRPINGREKVHTKVIFLDHFNQRPKRFISPAGSNANNGLTEATAWRDRAWAEANAPQGARVVVAAGDYRQKKDEALTGIVAGASSTSTIKANVTNDMPVLLEAAQGVAQDAIVFGTGQQDGGFRTGTHYWFGTRVRYRGIAMDWTNFKTLRAAGTIGALKPALAWENAHNFEGSLADPRPLGPVVDPSNGNVVDPDETANPGCGGLGFYYDNTTNYPDPSQVFYGADGTWYSMENCQNQIISLRGATTSLHFELGCNGIHGFDAVYIGASTARGLLNPDGSPKNDSDDFAIINSVHYFPGRTPFKQRFHTTPTVRIKAVQLLKDSTGTDAERTLKWGTSTFTTKLGFTKITFDVQVDQTQPGFNPVRALSGDNVIRFIKGNLAGVFETATGVSGADAETYGWRLLALSTQSADPTINGVATPLGQYECIIAGDFTKAPYLVVAGDMCVLFNKQHTDCFQTAPAAVGGPNNFNWMVQTYTAKGPGFGNMVLYQPVNSDNPQNGTASVSATGLMSAVDVKTPPPDAQGRPATASTAFPLRVGDCITCTDTGTYLAQRYQVAFVEKVNGDGTYQLSRPFVSNPGDGTFPAVAVTGMAITVNKSVVGTAFVNVQIACPNTGQLGGGLRNNQFLASTFISYLGGGSTPTNTFLMRIVPNGGIHAMAIWDTLMVTPSGTNCLSIPNYGDPRRDGYVLNCGFNKAGGYPAAWSANDNSTVALPSLDIDLDTFKVKAGMTRTVGASRVPFDGLGAPRVFGVSLIGSQPLAA